jgi:hypothetical protein
VVLGGDIICGIISIKFSDNIKSNGIKKTKSQAWRFIPVISAFGRQED